jgi:glyoxylate reductase
MQKPKVFITRRLPGHFLEALKEDLDVIMWEKEYEPVPRKWLLDAAKEADGLLTMLSDSVDVELLGHAPKLKVIANLAVGYDNIDVSACTDRGVVVCNTPDVLTETTADLTFALLMATARRLVEAAELVKNDEWKEWGPFLLAGKDIHHKTLGIVGMGRIGSAVAKRAKGFDMNILYHNRSPKNEVERQTGAELVSFEYLLENADFVVCLTPLTKDTVHLFDERAFKLMKKDAIFINVGRGNSVDEEALFKAIKTGEIAGTGLDVFSQEPISASHPLLTLKQVVALPHIGSASVETRSEMIKLAIKNLRTVLIDKQKAPTALN